MDSTILTPVGDALAAALATIDMTPSVTVLWDPAGDRWAPARIGKETPVVVVNVPSVRRTDLLEAENEIGSDDWLLTFDINLHVDLKVAGRDQQRIVELLEKTIAAIDDDPTLGDPTIDDAKVVTADPVQDLSDENRPLLTYDLEVQVWKRVPTT